MSDSGSIDKTPQKKGRLKKADKNDPFRFQAPGVNFKAKLIGVEDVADARGDKMCQEAIQRLKAMVKVSGEHKQRIIVNVSLEGLVIIDEKTGNQDHKHAVHKISFISRDTTDARAFGYIYGPGGGTHKFFGIKTEKAAEGLVLTLRDLFQVVFELKKKEVEEAKKKKEDADVAETVKEETSPKQDDSTADQKDREEVVLRSDDATSSASSAVGEVPKSGGTGNLLDLENELVTIQEGINQMNAFGDSMSVTSDSQSEGSVTPSPWGKPDAWAGMTNGTQSSNTQAFAAFGQPAPPQQQQAFSSNLSSTTTTEQNDLFSLNAQAFSAPSMSQPGGLATATSTMNAFAMQSQPGMGTAGANLFNSNSSPFSTTVAPPVGGMQGSMPAAMSSPWPTQNTGLSTPAPNMANMFNNTAPMGMSHSSQLGAFGTPAVSQGGAARVQADPFKNDPFFANAVPVTTMAAPAAAVPQMNNPFAPQPAAGFGMSSQPPANNNSNAFGSFDFQQNTMSTAIPSASPFASNTNGAFGMGASTAPTLNSGAANPFDMMAPTLVPQNITPEKSEITSRPAVADPFSGLCEIGSGTSKKDFFKDTTDKPSLMTMKVGEDDSWANAADSGHGDSSSSPATSIEWATPPTVHKPATDSTKASNTSTTNTLSPPEVHDFNLPSPDAPPPPLPSIPGLNFSYDSPPPPPPPRPGLNKQLSTTSSSLHVGASGMATSSATKTTVTVTTAQSQSTEIPSSVTIVTSRQSPSSQAQKIEYAVSPPREVQRSRERSQSASQSPVIPRPRSKKPFKTQSSLQFTTDPFAEAWQWPSDPAKTDPFTSDPFTSPLDPFGSFSTESDPFSQKSEQVSDPFAASPDNVRSEKAKKDISFDSMNKNISTGIDPFTVGRINDNPSTKDPDKDSKNEENITDPFAIPKAQSSKSVESSPKASKKLGSSYDPFDISFNLLGSSDTSSLAPTSPDPFIISHHHSLLKPKLIKQNNITTEQNAKPKLENSPKDFSSNDNKPAAFVAGLFSIPPGDAHQQKVKDPFMGDPFFTENITNTSTHIGSSDPFSTFDPFNTDLSKTSTSSTVVSSETAEKVTTTLSSTDSCINASSYPSTAFVTQNPFESGNSNVAMTTATTKSPFTATKGLISTKGTQSLDKQTPQASSVKLVNPDPFDLFRAQDKPEAPVNDSPLL